MTIRENIDRALERLKKPEPFILTTLASQENPEGIEVFIRQASARRVSEWWTWMYEDKKRPKLYDEIIVEAFSRFCVDAADVQQYPSRKDVETLRDAVGSGKFIAEFFTEAQRRNFLYERAEQEDQHRRSFFAKLEAAKVPPAAEVQPSSESSGG
jgi:hypothetical protein